MAEISGEIAMARGGPRGCGMQRFWSGALGRDPKRRPNLRMECGCVRSTSRSSSKAGDVEHVLNGFMLPTRCGWVFDHSRAPDRQFGSHPVLSSALRAEVY